MMTAPGAGAAQQHNRHPNYERTSAAGAGVSCEPHIPTPLEVAMEKLRTLVAAGGDTAAAAAKLEAHRQHLL
jgi:hypothetical protein